MERTHYTQLTLEERYHIQVMRKQGKSLRSISSGMGRSHSSLSRELRRNKGGRGYRHKQADRLAAIIPLNYAFVSNSQQGFGFVILLKGFSQFPLILC